MAARVLRKSKVAGVSLVLTDDQRFQVLAGDEVLADTKVDSYAMIAYDEAVAERTEEHRRRLTDERIQYEVNAVRGSSMKKATSRRGNGGRGGRGGV